MLNIIKLLKSLFTKSASAYDALKLQTFHTPYSLTPQNDTKSSASEEELSAPTVVTPTFPTDASLWGARVFASLLAVNQSTADHTIRVTLQKNVDGGGWEDAGFETTHDILALPEVKYAQGLISVIRYLTLVSGETITFRWQVHSDDAGEVHYLSNFLLIVSYDFHET